MSEKEAARKPCRAGMKKLKKLRKRAEALPEPLRKLALDRLAARERAAAVDAVDAFLDKAASALPVEKRARVRVLQAQLSLGTGLQPAVKLAYDLDDARAHDLAVKIAAEAEKLASVLQHEEGVNASEASRFSAMGHKAVTRSDHVGDPASGNAFLGR